MLGLGKNEEELSKTLRKLLVKEVTEKKFVITKIVFAYLMFISDLGEKILISTMLPQFKAKPESMYHDVRYIRANIWLNYTGFMDFSLKFKV